MSKTQEAVELLEKAKEWYYAGEKTEEIIDIINQALAILKPCEVCGGEKYICGGCEKPAGDITIHRGEHWISGSEPNLDEPCGPIIPCPKCQDHIVNSNKKVEPAEKSKRRQGKHKLVYDKETRTIAGYCKKHDVYYQPSGQCHKCNPAEPAEPMEFVKEFRNYLENDPLNFAKEWMRLSEQACEIIKELMLEKADREEYIGNLEAEILKETENG